MCVERKAKETLEEHQSSLVTTTIKPEEINTSEKFVFALNCSEFLTKEA